MRRAVCSLVVLVAVGACGGGGAGTQVPAGFQAACRADVIAVQSAQLSYRTTNGSYAPNIDALVPQFLSKRPQSAAYTLATDSSGQVTVERKGPLGSGSGTGPEGCAGS